VSLTIDKLDRLLNLGDIGFWKLHVPSGEVTRNGSFSRLIQVEPKDLAAGLTEWAKRIHPADRDAVLEKRRKLLAGDIEAYSVDYRIARPDGGWVALRGHVVVHERDVDGKPLWVCGITTNVSREYGLAHKFHALVHRPFQDVSILAPDGRLLDSSHDPYEQPELSREIPSREFIWESPAYLDAPGIQQRIMKGVAEAAGGALVRFHVTTPSAGESHRVVDFTLTPLRDAGGKIINIIAEERDISEFAQTQAALQISEKRLHVATQQMHIGLWEADPATGQTWCNDECYKMIGCEPDGSLGTTAAWLSLIHPDDRPRVGLLLDQHIAGATDEYRVHYRVRCKDGSYRWIMSQACAMDRGADGSAGRVTGIRFDITELKAMEQQLASAQRLESIGQLAAGVAHEINTPIQYVNDSVYFVREAVQELLGYLNKALAASPGVAPNSDLTYLQENLPPTLDRAIDGLARVTEIVGSMKEFSHPDQQEKTPVDLNRAIHSTLIVARSEYKYVATVSLELGVLPAVTYYGSQINQVVLNLVVNAAHAIADRVKGTEAKGVITLKTVLEGDTALISVSDTGGGIPEAVRDRIFEPFFTTKEVGRGTGQGLTLVHNIVVKGHGGSISFETKAGVGTTFFVRLPIESAFTKGKERAA
jgi:PAS domain S-box-containing protein